MDVACGQAAFIDNGTGQLAFQALRHPEWATPPRACNLIGRGRVRLLVRVPLTPGVSRGAHVIGDVALARRARAKTLDRAANVGLGPVLGQLDFRIEPSDDQLDTDDAFRLATDVAIRRIVDRPRIGTFQLVPVDESSHMGQQPLGSSCAISFPWATTVV